MIADSFLPSLSTPGSMKLSNNSLKSSVQYPTGNSVTLILSAAIFSYNPLIKNFSSLILDI